RCGIDPAELDRVEAQIRLDLEPYGGAQRLRRELPWLVVQLARLRFGTVGPSNHFVELQEVEEILDPVVASRLGVHQGQVTLQYHAGGGAREGFGGDGPQLVVDSPHNSIYEEEVRGAPAVVHRHNSCRAFPASKMVGHPVFADTGQPVLLPGSHRTSSYLCVAAEGSA